jgi:N-acetyl-alpha-D-muramate 1-phosphate uridylyltransferase
MKAMILAAGRGERMRPLTDHTPKPLLEVGGKALIVWHLERLAKAGFKQVIINHAHLGAQIEAALGNGAQWGLSIHYSPEDVALETAGGIVKAMPVLTGDGDQTFLVINGDIFSDYDFGRLPALTKAKLAHLVLVDNPPQHPQGDFVFNGEGLALQGNPKLTFSGIGLYRAELFSSIKAGAAAKLAPLLNAAISSGQAIAEHHRGIWHDVGTPERLQELDAQLRECR